MPSRFRVLYINLVTVGWDVFLSYMKHFDEVPVSSLEVREVENVAEKEVSASGKEEAKIR